MIDTEKIIEYWRYHAGYDIETAESLFNSGRYPYCLFMAHQAIEKLLKAQIAKITKDHAPYGHNLLRLAELGSLPFSKEQTERLAEITEFNLKARYDDYLSNCELRNSHFSVFLRESATEESRILLDFQRFFSVS